MNNLILQSFGREGEYKRAILTILSYFTHIPAPYADSRVLLFTDKPEYFAPYVSGLPVDYVLLTPEKIREMRGAIDFLHRMKIALIEEAFAKTTGNMLYADSDTFFTANPLPLLDQVSEDKAFMHLHEYRFVRNLQDSTKTYHDFLDHVVSRDFELSDGSRLRVTPEHSSWNAGVMFFHPSHVRFIADVYKLTDQFYPASGSHASEQYAFSLMLQEHLRLEACDSVIYHYWYRIKKQIVDQFLDKELGGDFAGRPLHSKLEAVKRWTAMLPAHFEQHDWMIRDHAVQAFNDNQFSRGYKWAATFLLRNPMRHYPFLKDVLYHMKRQLRPGG